MRKYISAAALTLVCVGIIYAEQKQQHRVKVSQLNERQVIVSCRNGNTPEVSNQIAGAVVVTCSDTKQ